MYCRQRRIAVVRGVARPWTKWKHNRRGVWGRLGPQWVQGRALVGGTGGRSPPAENRFQANRRPIRMYFWGCFGCSKAAFICECTEYFIENFIWFSYSQTPINFRIRPFTQVTLTLTSVFMIDVDPWKDQTVFIVLFCKQYDATWCKQDTVYRCVTCHMTSLLK